MVLTGVSHVGAVALGALRAAGAFRAPSAGHWPAARRADTRAVGVTVAGMDSILPINEASRKPGTVQSVASSSIPCFIESRIR